ncbi:MAG TPA: DUF2892 domain-containing protein [Gemmatimonadales bacterium]|nr:DUF2892 domain-containing protein [Gemmatimonadales bacterium]
MTRTIGTAGRLIRLVLGVMILGLYGALQPPLRYLALLGLIPLGAALTGKVYTMKLRSGIYIVPTHRWYVERTVWLIAGLVLLAGTSLALLVDPRWIFLVIATAVASIVVALTGFCIVGNLLIRLGFTPMLGDQARARGKLYFMQTDRWYLERRIYLAVGINLIVASTLSLVWSPWWLLFTGFVGGAMIWFAATGYCIMANGLYWLGAEPRLAPETGRRPVERLRDRPA